MILLFLVIPFVSGVCPPGYSDRYVYPYQASGKSLDFFEYQLRRVRFHYVRNFSLYLPEPRKECVQLVHYNAFASLGCALPKDCGVTKYKMLPVSFFESLFGAKTMFCYGEVFAYKLIGTFDVYKMTYDADLVYPHGRNINIFFKTTIDAENVLPFYYLLHNRLLGFFVLSKLCVESLMLVKTPSTLVYSFDVQDDTVRLQTESFYPSGVCPDYGYMNEFRQDFTFDRLHALKQGVAWRIQDWFIHPCDFDVFYEERQCHCEFGVTSNVWVIESSHPQVLVKLPENSVTRCFNSCPKESWLYPIVVYVPVSETFVTVAQVLQNIMIDVFTTLGGILTGVFRESVPFMIDTVVSILKVLIDNALFLLDSLKLLEFVVMYPLIYLKFRDNYLTMMILIVCYIIRLLI